MADLAPADRRGLYMGTYGMVWAATFVFGPSLGLSLFSYDRTLLWLGCGVLGVVAAAIIARERRQSHQLEETLPTKTQDVRVVVT